MSPLVLGMLSSKHSDQALMRTQDSITLAKKKLSSGAARLASFSFTGIRPLSFSLRQQQAADAAAAAAAAPTSKAVAAAGPPLNKKLVDEQATNARMLAEFRKLLTGQKPAGIEKQQQQLGDYDESELEGPDFDKVDSIVMITLRSPSSLRVWQERADAGASAARPAAAAALASPEEEEEEVVVETDKGAASSAASKMVSPFELVQQQEQQQQQTAVVESTSSEPATASSSMAVAAAAASTTTTTAATTTSNSSSSRLGKQQSKGKRLFKSAGKKVAAFFRSVGEGMTDSSYAVTSASAMMALWPVPLPTAAYSSLYHPGSYDPYNPYNSERAHRTY